MLETFRKLWKIKDLQKKVLYTFLMLLIYRLVGVIPAPGIDVSRLNETNNFMQLPLLNMMQMMTGNAFGQMTIMAMGITPYINASIIMQLLAVAFPSLQRMQEEEGGQEKMARITRYVTVGLAVFQAIGLSRAGGYVRSGWYNTVLVGLSMAGGSALAMWIGERITDKGIGNGISLLIFAGIVSNLFNGITGNIYTAVANGTTTAWLSALVILLMLVVMTFAVTYVDQGSPCLRRSEHPHDPEGCVRRRSAPDLRVQPAGVPWNDWRAGCAEQRLHRLVQCLPEQRLLGVYDPLRAPDCRLHLLLFVHQL